MGTGAAPNGGVLCIAVLSCDGSDTKVAGIAGADGGGGGNGVIVIATGDTSWATGNLELERGGGGGGTLRSFWISALTGSMMMVLDGAGTAVYDNNSSYIAVAVL